MAATDESVAAVYRFLDARYPGSKFVLTERAEDEWIDSTRAQRQRFAPFGVFLASARHSGYWRDRAIEVQFTQMTLYGTTEFDEPRFRDGFRRHHDAVAHYFKERPEALLRIRICDGDGWGQLCEFLARPVPAIPFPHSNARTGVAKVPR